MRTVNPAYTAVLLQKLKQPSPTAWAVIENEGRINLPPDAYERIATAVLTYVVAGETVRCAPQQKGVRKLVKAITDAADDPGELGPLLQALEAMNADGVEPLSARIFWSEAGSVELGQLLLQLHLGHPPLSDLLGPIQRQALAALELIDAETTGHTQGPKSLAAPASELLSVLVPLYQAAGGKISYHDEHLASDLPQSTPLVRFVGSICQQFIPYDWPSREQLVLTDVAWSKRIARFLAARNKRAKTK
jgi:hypothetical protein